MFAYGISDTGKSSTAEMVFDFIVAAGHTEKIDKNVAQCIYAGVMTDTGSFRFTSTSASVHRMVADLKDRGLQHSNIHENLFDNFLESRFRFFGHVLLNRMELFYEYNTALIAIPIDVVRARRIAWLGFSVEWISSGEWQMTTPLCRFLCF